MEVRVAEVEFFLSECATRIPFQFGVATMTWAPNLLCRVRVEAESGATAAGFSADLVVPKWFDKDPAKTFEDNIRELKSSAVQAAAAFREAGAASVFELWRRAYDARVGLDAADAPDVLTRGFGVALLERAVMDATCRAAGQPFFTALTRDLFGFRPERVHPGLEGFDLAQSLGAAPARSVVVRHTVGLADPLRAADIPPAERVEDGLPQALEEDIAVYGLRCFKIKLYGDRERDLQRLRQVGELLAERVPEGLVVTVDGNEQFEDLGLLREELEVLGRTPAGRHLLDALQLIEQPLARAQSFDRHKTAPLADLAGYAPVIIDEADYGVRAFPAAAECGYRGISVKNCKGVFRALLNRGLCELYTRKTGAVHFQSPEDLTNVPVVALQEDLATVAALGFPHVERNGHHYFRGLDHLPESERRAAREHHPDLYREDAAGTFLTIENGALSLGSLQCTGYGYAPPPEIGWRTPLA